MRRLLLACLLLLPAATAGEIFRDDFSRFPPRIFSEPVKQLTNALHEYHYVHDRGVSLEVVLWDRHSVSLYTQDRPFQGAKIYAPIRIRITTIRTTGWRYRCRTGKTGKIKKKLK